MSGGVVKMNEKALEDGRGSEARAHCDKMTNQKLSNKHP